MAENPQAAPNCCHLSSSLCQRPTTPPTPPTCPMCPPPTDPGSVRINNARGTSLKRRAACRRTAANARAYLHSPTFKRTRQIRCGGWSQGSNDGRECMMMYTHKLGIRFGSARTVSPGVPVAAADATVGAPSSQLTIDRGRDGAFHRGGSWQRAIAIPQAQRATRRAYRGACRRANQIYMAWSASACGPTYIHAGKDYRPLQRELGSPAVKVFLQ